MKMKYSLILVTVILIIGMAVLVTNQGFHDDQKVNASQDVVRFHVLANSDSAYDQAVKHKVRDAVIACLTPLLNDVPNAATAKKIVMEQREQIKNTANTVLISYNAPYRAEVIDGRYQFPIKAYGDLILPAGDYDAVKILLGDAKGSNWWCVLFPPLCFIDMNNATTVKSQDNNKDSQNSNARKVEFKLKLLELMEVNSQR